MHRHLAKVISKSQLKLTPCRSNQSTRQTNIILRSFTRLFLMSLKPFLVSQSPASQTFSDQVTSLKVQKIRLHQISSWCSQLSSPVPVRKELEAGLTTVRWCRILRFHRARNTSSKIIPNLNQTKIASKTSALYKTCNSRLTLCLTSLSLMYKIRRRPKICTEPVPSRILCNSTANKLLKNLTRRIAYRLNLTNLFRSKKRRKSQRIRHKLKSQEP